MNREEKTTSLRAAVELVVPKAGLINGGGEA